MVSARKELGGGWGLAGVGGGAVVEIKAALPYRAFEAETQWLRAFADTRQMMGH